MRKTTTTKIEWKRLSEETCIENSKVKSSELS